VTEPTMHEVVRRLDDVTRRLDTLVTSLEERYIPRREYELRVGELEKDIKDHADARKAQSAEQAAFRRQVAAGAILLLLGIVVQIIISLARTPGVAA